MQNPLVPPYKSVQLIILHLLNTMKTAGKKITKMDTVLYWAALTK